MTFGKKLIALSLIALFGIPTAHAQSMSKQVIDVILQTFGIQSGQFFVWALGLGAVLAFGVIIYGGVLWSVSMGGEQKNEAKEWIKGAVYGLLLLAAGYLILNTINPDLVRF